MSKIILVGLLTIGLLVLVFFSYMGLVPFLSPLLGSGPKDLGIRITKDDSIKAFSKMGTEYISITSTDSIKDFTLEGKREIEVEMNSMELTAFSNNRPWKNYPIRHMQIKIHPDGTIESTGILIISKAMSYATALGYSETQIKEAMNKYNIPPFEVPFYVKGLGSVSNNKVSVNAQHVKVGFVTIPSIIVSQANTEAEKVLDDVIQKQSQSFSAESLSFQSGKMLFKGAVAKKAYYVTE